MILITIITIIVLLLSVIYTIQLMRIKRAFNAILVKFVNINQAYYENQKIITHKFSNLIVSLDKSINEQRDALQNTKVNFDNQVQASKDISLKLLTLNKKVESYSSEAGKIYEQLKRFAVQSPKPKPEQRNNSSL